MERGDRCVPAARRRVNAAAGWRPGHTAGGAPSARGSTLPARVLRPRFPRAVVIRGLARREEDGPQPYPHEEQDDHGHDEDGRGRHVRTLIGHEVPLWLARVLPAALAGGGHWVPGGDREAAGMPPWV